MISEDELSDDTKELIAETKKGLNEIEKVVGEFQAKQKEMQRFVNKTEAEVERLESKELDIIRNLKAKATSQQHKNRGKLFSFVFWFFSLIFVAFLAVVIQYAPIEYQVSLCVCFLTLISWEYVSDKWEYVVEYFFDFFGIHQDPINAPY